MDSKSKPKIRNIILALLVVMINASEILYCQDLPVVSQGRLKFYFDTSSFRGKSDSTYQEFYLMFHADQLSEIDNIPSNTRSLKISTKTFNNNGEQISTMNWITEVNFSIDTTNLKEMVSFDQWSQYLLPGKYKILVNIADTGGVSIGNLSANFNVKKMDESILSVSDIQFIFKTEEKVENSIFSKAGFNIFPNVWRRYGALSPKLTFYYEVYEIDTSSNDPMYIQYAIKTIDQSIVKSINNLELTRTANQRSVIHAIDVSSLPSSVYYLTITVTDSSNLTKAFTQRNFEAIQLDRYAKISNLSSEDIEMFDLLFSYIVQDSEYQFYKKLNDSEKEVFILNFWNNKDPNPATEENEYLLSILEKFNYANQNFSWGNESGWESDRGRVLIQYGMPYEIESHDSEPSSVPYEVWTYQLDKNYIFIFIDRNSTGKFVLTHSTMEGEVSNPSWISLVKE